MTIISTVGLETPDSTEAVIARPLFQPVFDAEEYRADLAGLNLTEAQESELLETLWSIMGAFARMGFSTDVCGLIFKEFNEASAPESGDGNLLASTTTNTETPAKDGGEEGNT